MKLQLKKGPNKRPRDIKCFAAQKWGFCEDVCTKETIFHAQKRDGHVQAHDNNNNYDYYKT